MFYIEDFLYSLKMKYYSEKTVNAYAIQLHHFIRYFDKKGISQVSSISEEMIREYLDSFGKKSRGSKDFYVKVIRLRKYFEFLEEKTSIFLSPLRNYPNPKFLSHSFPKIDNGKMDSILDSIKPESPFLIRGKAILELAYSSALRPREIYKLKITDIDFKNETLFISQSKGKKDRLVPVGEKALYWISEYIEKVRSRYIKDQKHMYVFISHKTGNPLTVWGLRSAIQDTLRRNGFDPFPPYSLRSASATALFLGGMGIAYIGKLLGHAELRTTQSYLNVRQIRLTEELARKHPRNTFSKRGVER